MTGRSLWGSRWHSISKRNPPPFGPSTFPWLYQLGS